MPKSKKLLSFISLLSFVSFASCIWEKETICDTHLCFVYDYNLQYTDLFPKEVNQLTVYVFDDQGMLHHIYTDETIETFPTDYKMDVVLEENDYTFIVWCGLNEDFYTYPETRSKNSINEMKLRLTPDDDNYTVNRQLPSLWHGKLEKHWDKYSPGTVRLIKNTNTFRIVMKNLDDEGDNIDIHDFDIILSSSNGVYNYGNEPEENVYQYYPYYKANNPESGAIAELNTLRLMAKQQNNLEVINKATGENILGKKVNLNTYLDALRLVQYGNLPLQEYLDRENQYGIVFFYKGFNKENPSFSTFDIQINGWSIREQDLEY